MSVTKRIVVLFSGSGTNLENITQTLHNQTFDGVTIRVAKAISNTPKAGGIARAKRHNIDVEVVDHTLFDSREAFDKALVEAIEHARPDLVVLAGFMRILTKEFTNSIKNVINLHPSLLPLFKGAHAIVKSYHSDMRVAGVSIHYVNDELDGGKIIEQGCFYKEAGVSFEEFEAKIHELEYRLYPKVIRNILCKEK